jgi:hypothetical protein
MLKMIMFIGWVVVAIEAFIALNMLVTQDNPCSVWAKHPQACSSDITQDLGK